MDINKSDYFSDQNGKEWKCTLLNEHTYSPQIKETNNADWISVTFLVIALASKAVVLLALIKGSDD